MTKQFIVDVNEQGQITGQKEYTGQATAVHDIQVVHDGISIPTATGLGIIIVAIIILGSLSILMVKQQSVRIIERLGKFKKIVTAGLNFRMPFIDRVAGEMDLRTQQFDVTVNTKTLDNVFIDIRISVQYFIDSTKVYEAFYKLEDPKKQILSYICDVVRSEVPKLKLDDTFSQKEQIAVAIKAELGEKMTAFGYNILQALVVDIDPDAKVKASMNDINVAQRTQVASTARGEADKIIVIKKAEAEAESKALQGKGIASERLAIAEGIKSSMAMMKEAGLPSDEIMATLLLTQYFDTMKEMGRNGASTVFLPASPTGVGQFGDEIRNAIMSGNKVK